MRVRTLSGPFRVLVSLLPALALFDGGCQDAQLPLYPTNHTDLYNQEPLRKVDVLLVVDSSGSMEEEQQKLATNFQGFIQAFSSAQVDYHIGVINTDIENQAVAGLLQGDVKYITPDTPDAASVFASNVMVGTEGSGLEMGLEGAWLALTEPRISQQNAGFFREDASLSIVVVSDENDMSPGSVDDYLNYFAMLKGEGSYRDHTQMNLSAVAGDVPSGCTSLDGSGVAVAGFRYADAASRTDGIFASICSADFAPIVRALGLDLSGLRSEFPLTRCARSDTLSVTVDGRIEQMGIPWVYVPERKSIQFSANWIPEPGAEIIIHYEFYTEDTNTCPAE